MTGTRRQGGGRRFETLLARPLLLPPSAFLTFSLRRLARVHPEAFARLGEYGHRLYLIAPTDLPLAFCPVRAESELVTRVRSFLADTLRLRVIDRSPR